MFDSVPKHYGTTLRAIIKCGSNVPPTILHRQSWCIDAAPTLVTTARTSGNTYINLLQCTDCLPLGTSPACCSNRTHTVVRQHNCTMPCCKQRMTDETLLLYTLRPQHWYARRCATADAAINPRITNQLTPNHTIPTQEYTMQALHTAMPILQPSTPAAKHQAHATVTPQQPCCNTNCQSTLSSHKRSNTQQQNTHTPTHTHMYNAVVTKLHSSQGTLTAPVARQPGSHACALPHCCCCCSAAAAQA